MPLRTPGSVLVSRPLIGLQEVFVSINTGLARPRKSCDECLTPLSLKHPPVFWMFDVCTWQSVAFPDKIVGILTPLPLNTRRLYTEFFTPPITRFMCNNVSELVVYSVRKIWNIIFEKWTFVWGLTEDAKDHRYQKFSNFFSPEKYEIFEKFTFSTEIIFR